jgi:hypothetical protein
MALFTLLDDGLPPSGSGLVSLEPPYALPTAFAGGRTCSARVPNCRSSAFEVVSADVRRR